MSEKGDSKIFAELICDVKRSLNIGSPHSISERIINRDAAYSIALKTGTSCIYWPQSGEYEFSTRSIYVTPENKRFIVRAAAAIGEGIK